MKIKLAALLLLLSPVPALAQDSVIAPAQTTPIEPAATEAAATAPADAALKPVAPETAASAAEDANGYSMEEVAAAADGAFGKATEGVAMVIERTFKDLGRPTAYIVGREGGGAFIVGLRYGRGKLYHKVEGVRDVHWTGPSVGLDFGGDASRSFVLVYNLNDSEDLYTRFPAIEGKAYLIGGVSANYHQRGNVVLVPIRLGAGWRLGVNAGYLHYTKKGRILPF